MLQPPGSQTRGSVGRFDDALVAYRQTIELEPTMALPYANIGDVHGAGLGRFDTALLWYEKAARVDPGNPEMAAGVALMYWELGNDTEAGRWRSTASATGDGTAYTNFIAALLDLQWGNARSALTHAQKAFEMDPWYMSLMRDPDVRAGRYAAARARYAKGFPYLFAKEVPPLMGRDAFVAIELSPHARRMRRSS